MSEALIINDDVTLPGTELTVRAVRSSGPGGQNVNKVASKIELRFALSTSRVLPVDAAVRLRTLARGRLDAAGDLVITSQSHREQPRNLEDARAKLRELVLAALVRPRPRRPTRPSRGSKERRLGAKARTSERKRDRRKGSDD